MDKQYFFGTSRLPRSEHASAVAGVFANVATRYDLMNDLMSMGMHRLWKRKLASWARPRSGESWLDLAAGSGDITELLAQQESLTSIVAADPSEHMLATAKKRLVNFTNVSFLHTTAEQLSLADGSCDGVTCAFGLRNFTEPNRALSQIARCIASGGRVLILEFSPPRGLLSLMQRNYLDFWIPKLGEVIAGDKPSYRYLADSILNFPPPDTIADWLRVAGFVEVEWCSLATGLVSLHRGWKV